MYIRQQQTGGSARVRCGGRFNSHRRRRDSTTFHGPCFAHFLRAGVVLLAALAATTAPRSAGALEIKFTTYQSGQAENPGYDSDHSRLDSVLGAAARRWEDIIEDNHTIEFKYRWEDGIGGSDVVARTLPKKVNNGRVTKANIVFNNNSDWYIDSTPSRSEEFDMGPTFYNDADHGGDYVGSPPQGLEVGFFGKAKAGTPAANKRVDLLSTAMHEIGHTLGGR